MMTPTNVSGEEEDEESDDSEQSNGTTKIKPSKFLRQTLN